MNIIEEFLVKLGFEADEGSFRQFGSALKEAELAVERSVGGMTKSLLGLQGTTLGAFASISAGIVTMADKVAMADQSYRLLGLRFLMTTDTARTLSMTAKALGMDMETLMRAAPWDPELMQRSLALFRDIAEMTGELGPRFEQNMKGIRDIRFEFQRLGVGIEFLKMQFASDLFEKLHLDAPRITKFVDEFEAKIPELANKLSDYAIPILKDTWSVFEELGEAAKEFVVLFDNVVGILSGDTSIEGASFSFDKLSKSIEHVLDWMKEFFTLITQLETSLTHFAIGVSQLFERKFGEAANEFKQGFSGIGEVLGTGMGGAGLGAGIGMVAGGPIGGVLGAAAGGLLGKEVIGPLERGSREGAGPRARGESGDLAARAWRIAEEVAGQTGISAKLIFEQFAHETGNFTNRGARMLHNFAGVNVPGGGGQDYRSFTSDEDFASYFSGLLLRRYSKYGVLGAQNEQQYAEALKAGGYFSDSPEHYIRGMLHARAMYAQMAKDYMNQAAGAFAPAAGGLYAGLDASGRLAIGTPGANGRIASGAGSIQQQVHIAGIYITQPNADARQIQQAVAAGVRDGLRAQTQVDLAQMAPPW